MDLSPQEIPRPWEDPLPEKVPLPWKVPLQQAVPIQWVVPLQWMDLSPQEIPRPWEDPRPEMNPPMLMVKHRPKSSGTTIPAKTPKAATTSGKVAWSAPT